MVGRKNILYENTLQATFGDTVPVGNFVKIGKAELIDIYKLCTAEERKFFQPFPETYSNFQSLIESWS